jgi:uncharacterized protein YkwD
MKRLMAFVLLATTPAWAQPSPIPDMARVAELVVEGTNHFRHDHGLGPVTPERRLSGAAREFAAYMAQADRLDHAADGRQPWGRARAQGYDYCLVAENIAFQYDSRGFATAQLAHELVSGWERSAGHRKNMLERDAVDTAVAIARSPRTGRYYAVQMFGRPRVNGRCAETRVPRAG